MSDPYAPQPDDAPDPGAHTPPTSSPAPPLPHDGSSSVPPAGTSPYAAAPPEPAPSGQPDPANPYGAPAAPHPYGAPTGTYGAPSADNPYGVAAGPQPPYPGNPYPQYGPGYYAGYSTPAQPKTNGLAIAAMVLALCGLLTCITAPVGAIMGHVALNRIKQTGEQGRGMALTGVIVGWVLTGLLVAYILFVVLVIAAGW